MDLGLTARSAVVCGASSGIGLSIATALASEGARVSMVARREETLAAEAARIGGNPLPGDLTHPSMAQRIVDEAVAWGGGLDILVWNSGGPAPGTASELGPEQLLAAVELLYLPAVRLIRAALPHLRQSTAGRILAITASGVKEPVPQIASSNAVRPGLAGYLKSLATDLGPTGVTVNCIAPGRILTDRMRQVFPDGMPPEQLADIPLGHYGRAEDIAATATFLVSGPASYLTGTTINVDGGLARSIF